MQILTPIALYLNLIWPRAQSGKYVHALQAPTKPIECYVNTTFALPIRFPSGSPEIVVHSNSLRLGGMLRVVMDS